MKTLLALALLLPTTAFTQNITPTTNITITKTWSQEPNGYTYPISISVPPGSEPTGGFPVCILLHGNGGNGGAMINQFSSVLDCHVLVAPSGYANSWNICAENSDAPDLEMIDDLVNTIQGYSNINPNRIRVLGSSNGAGLANNIFIENINSGIDVVCSIVSHLNEPQFHLGNFYRANGETTPSNSYCNYTTQTSPLTTRKYLSISNDNDPVIPYEGGTSPVGVDFLHAETAAYNIALNQGYIGNQITSGSTIGNLTEFSYLSGQVVHIKGDAAHSANSDQLDYVHGYFSNCSSEVSIESNNLESIKIYPIPSNDYLTIKMDKPRPVNFSILSVSGKKVYEGKINDQLTKVEIFNLKPGMYVLVIEEKVIRFEKNN